MADTLFGLETEYAIAGASPESGLCHEEIVQRLLTAAQQKLIHLPDLYGHTGVFLANGARFYVDCGLHPEFSTPECSNPWDVVRYTLAGHKILEDLLASVEAEGKTEILAFRSNVDYSGSLSTWGCHESYLHREPAEKLQPHLIPHLVTRVIYTGAGGFHPLAPGLEFTLSPRAAHIQHVVSGNSTADRGLWHTKEEPLSARYGRLHLICGESLCSETAAFLKIGVTALVVAMADAGVAPGAAVQFADPLESLHSVAGDVTCKRPLAMADGSRRTAIDIQRHYLRLAEQNLDRAFMPSWAGQVCRRWRVVLDQLEDAPRSVERTLDWAIKRTLYANHAARAGLRWDALPFWNQIIDKLLAA